MINRLWGRWHIAFQQTIRQVRKSAGLTQTQLSKQLAKPQSYVSKYESGERRLDYLEVRKICACCEITITEFENFLVQTARNLPKLRQPTNNS